MKGLFIVAGGAIRPRCEYDAHVQDLRDIAGGTANGRKTLLIVFGDRCSRGLITLIAMPLQLLAL